MVTGGRLIAMAMMRLGEILVYSGWLAESQLRSALLKQKRTGLMLGQVLVEYKFLPEETVLRAIGIQQEMPVVDLENTPAPATDAAFLLTRAQCEAMQCVVLAVHGRVIDIAVCDGREKGLAEIRRITQKDVRAGLTTRAALVAALDRWGIR